MTKTTEKDMETLGEAAHRLLQDLDARLKRPAAESAAQIEIGGEGPSVPPRKAPKAECEHWSAALKAFGVATCHGGVRQGLELNVLRIYAHANDDDWGLDW